VATGVPFLAPAIAPQSNSAPPEQADQTVAAYELYIAIMMQQGNPSLTPTSW
jgi:hypothetical protein